MHLCSGLGLGVAPRLDLRARSLLRMWSQSLRWKEGLHFFFFNLSIFRVCIIFQAKCSLSFSLHYGYQFCWQNNGSEIYANQNCIYPRSQQGIWPRQFAISISNLLTTHSPVCRPGMVYCSMFVHNAPSLLPHCRATKPLLAIVSSIPSLISNDNYNLSHTFQYHCSPGLAHVHHIFSNRLCLNESSMTWCLEHSGHPSILSE